MKTKNICKDLNFSDCELAILRIAVDKAEEKIAKTSYKFRRYPKNNKNCRKLY